MIKRCALCSMLSCVKRESHAGACRPDRNFVVENGAFSKKIARKKRVQDGSCRPVDFLFFLFFFFGMQRTELLTKEK